LLTHSFAESTTAHKRDRQPEGSWGSNAAKKDQEVAEALKTNSSYRADNIACELFIRGPVDQLINERNRNENE
jgi:hypothetical protein